MIALGDLQYSGWSLPVTAALDLAQFLEWLLTVLTHAREVCTSSREGLSGPHSLSGLRQPLTSDRKSERVCVHAVTNGKRIHPQRHFCFPPRLLHRVQTLPSFPSQPRPAGRTSQGKRHHSNVRSSHVCEFSAKMFSKCPVRSAGLKKSHERGWRASPPFTGGSWPIELGLAPLPGAQGHSTSWVWPGCSWRQRGGQPQAEQRCNGTRFGGGLFKRHYQEFANFIQINPFCDKLVNTAIAGLAGFDRGWPCWQTWAWVRVLNCPVVSGYTLQLPRCGHPRPLAPGNAGRVSFGPG